MIELAATPTRTAAGHTAGHDRLDQLISRIATGDRTAFRRLYAFMAMRVWLSAIALPLGRAGAVAVTQSTFVEVWHQAGAAARYDARDWIAAISTRRANDRLRVVDADRRDGVRPVQHLATAPRLTHALTAGDYDTHIQLELSALLDTGRTIIRTRPGVFIRVDDLDDAIHAIAAASPAPVHATASSARSKGVGQLGAAAAQLADATTPSDATASLVTLNAAPTGTGNDLASCRQSLPLTVNGGTQVVRDAFGDAPRART